MRRRNLSIAAVTMFCLVAVFGLGAIPNASADGCTVTITVAGGQTFTFQNVPQGTNPNSLPLPVQLPIVSVSQTCPPVSATTPALTVTTSTQPQTTSTSTSTSASTSPKPAPSKPKPTTSTKTTAANTTTTSTTKTTATKTTTSALNLSPGTALSKASGKVEKGKKSKKKNKAHKKAAPPSPPPPVTKSGVPTPSNPTYSLALPGPAPIGVPNFFIDSFEIPPFLLPIYQAAGIQYDVPWQVLAAINEIETDYGRNLSVSTAGAVGWMQFLPSTWKRWAVDANGDGIADPYNPADAIFTAARYLQAAGASKNISQAIFAYNHAGWYVQSVLLRAQLIGGMPKGVIGALTGLVEGHFPVAAPAKYADDSVVKLAKTRVKTANAAVPVTSNPHTKGTAIYAKQGSPVIAANDGKIVKIGTSQTLGHYIELQDATGNTYTYANLGSIPAQYPVPKPVSVSSTSIAKALLSPSSPAPEQPATAGSQSAAPALGTAKAATQAKNAPISVTIAPATSGTQSPTSQPASAGTQDGTSPASQPAATPTISAPLVKERLFANPARPASYAAGGKLQVSPTAEPQIGSFDNYFSDVLHLAKNQYTLKPLKVGSVVVAGTILGRLGAGTPTDASHLEFMVQPAGKDAPYIDPKPILDGWKLLEATAVYRAAGLDPFVGSAAKNASIGQILLMSKEQLQYRVLEDPNVQIYPCGRRDIEDGAIDRRILGVIEFLSASGLKPDVTGLKCGHTANASDGVDSAGATGESVDISAINGIPVQGHQGKGSITDLAVRRLLTLQGAMQPDEIVSLMSYKGQPTALSLPDHANRIQIAYTPLYGANKQVSAEVSSILQPQQWTQLINHISQISEPIVPISPSKYAIKTAGQPAGQ
ncbi:MAG TPA: lytic murein transglycosylase [Solirubrobacteraceae bacterium]|nr:lytic murein transglycosylase [Solirubrobacteraceae bacterium]